MFERERVVRASGRSARPEQATAPVLPAGVQAALTVGSVDDPLEREADRVAADVVRALSGSIAASRDDATMADAVGASDEGLARSAVVGRIRRRSDVSEGPEVGPEGGEASGEISSRIRASAGRGNALPDGVRSRMEGAFGTDFGGVRIHRSSALAPRLGAEAFTVGSDIHFAPGRFQPSSSSGLHLLGHELTHVVQQSGGLARRDIRRSAPTSGGAADGRAAATVPGEVTADRRSDVVRASFGSKVKGFFKGAKKTAKAVFGTAEAQPDATTGNAEYDALSHEQKMANQRKVRGSGPGENPDYSNTAVWGRDPDRFVVTLAVAQENPAWMNNVKALKSTALKQIAKSPKELLSDLGAAKDLIIRQLLSERGALDGKTEDEIAQLVEEFTDGIHEVGHTWIRLSTYVGGTLKELYTYGMWPQQLLDPARPNSREFGGYNGFVDAGPGEVRHPDLAHEDDEMKAYMDYQVSAPLFDKALDLAIDRYNSPPPYVLTGYNCTAFAREVLMASGKSYPGKGLLPGFAYTPGDLYWAVMKEWSKGNKNAYTNERNQEAIDKIAAKQSAFEQAGKQEVVDDYRASTDEGVPDDTAMRKTVTLAKDSWLTFGEKPHRLDKNLKLDADMDVTVVADRDFRDRWDVVPIEFGSYFWFVSEDSYKQAKAGAKPGAQQVDDGLGAPATLALYSGQGGGFKPPLPSDQPWGVIGLPHAQLLRPQRSEGEWTEVVDHRGDFFWVRTVDHQELLNPSPKPSDPSGSGGGLSTGVIAWLTFDGDGLAMWDSTGAQANGTYRAKGKQIGATGRTKDMKGETYVEFVIDDITAWMPDAWWGMYFGSAYPTEATAPPTTDDRSLEIDDLLAHEFDEDDLEELSESTDEWDEDDRDHVMPEIVRILGEYHGFDPSTLSMVIAGGLQGVDSDLLYEVLDGPGGRSRAEAIATALGMSADEVMDLWGP